MSTQGKHGTRIPTVRVRGKLLWLPWVLLALLVVTLMLLTPAGGLLVRRARLSLLALLPQPVAPHGAGPLHLTVIGTNDTWGYVDPCG
ncbi:MAG: hypothetical protein ACUVX9_16745 [Anaerolineae bacterium]